MTTDLAPAEPAAPVEPATSTERELRMLPIVASLLPTEITDARRHRKVKRIVISALIAFVVLLGAWYGVARQQTAAARSSLAAAEADADRLQRQQNAFAELVRLQTESQAISTQLAGLLANDLQWSRLVHAVRAAAPEGVQISGVFGELKKANAAGSAANTVRLPSGDTEKVIGAITVIGIGVSKESVAAYADALAALAGIGNALLSDAAVKDGVVQFTLRLEITESALGGRYTAKSGNRPGGT